MSQIKLRVRLNAQNEKNARTVLRRLAALITFEIEEVTPHHENGFVALLQLPTPDLAWPDQVVAAIGLAQTMGSDWEVTGWIGEELEMHAGRFRISGITSASLSLRKPESDGTLRRSEET